MSRGTAQRTLFGSSKADAVHMGPEARKRWRDWLDRPQRREYRIIVDRRLHYVWRGSDLVAITVTMRAARRAVDRDVLDRVGYAA